MRERSCFAVDPALIRSEDAACTKDPMRRWTKVPLRAGPREADGLRRNEPAPSGTEMHMITVQPATAEARMP